MSRTSSRRRSSAPHPKSVQTKSGKECAVETKSAGTLVPKRRGELAELAFAFKAETLGFSVSKPYGDSEPYDFIVESRNPSGRCSACDTTRGGRSRKKRCESPPLWRIQVKCTTHLLAGFYSLEAQHRYRGHPIPYLPGEVDFLAAYIIPEDTWYVLPLEVAHERTTLLFRRHDDPRPSPYDAYREAWHLLRPRMKHCEECGADSPMPAAKRRKNRTEP